MCSQFQSETDTEIFAHLIQNALDKATVNSECDFIAVVQEALLPIEGNYALGILNVQYPDQLLFIRQGSPLIIGLGDDACFAASDIPAILSYTRRMLVLEDGDIAQLTRKGVLVYNSNGDEVQRPISTISWDPIRAEKGGYPHFMLKEIHEQPRAISDTLAGRLSSEQGRVYFETAFVPDDIILNIDRVLIIACGTSFHAGLTSCYDYERILGIPTSAEFASEFRYRNPILNDKTLVIAISQSGETADTLAAVDLAKQKGATVLSVCNMIESTIVRASDYVIYTHAGPEISVASTKAFVTQLVSLQLILLYIGKNRGILRKKELQTLTQDLLHLPTVASNLLSSEQQIQHIARRYAYAQNMLYLGRDIHYPLAMEGALKLKEISYIHAEAYPAGEMKHGPIALIDKDVPVFFIIHASSVREKVIANMEEIKARDGKIIALTLPQDEEVKRVADHVIEVPSISPHVDSILLSIPLQLFAYYVAVHRGTDVDQPRNLAKSVTVE
ncbi:glutamine--fructose-6-phosphate aminotransferase [isomerizing]-like [Ylistrum balloti]|uniref:glutamine--fructose-6-phosphate aminotransferase [isomerizing]-like n=1 Tax=Ylistrum balloti TaxID=509963 RepID=UPI00290596D8|nr:glutamine--fructose-6-phosphate aminotransferase [isomerizing]-like [Ylistrum balloti]